MNGRRQAPCSFARCLFMSTLCLLLNATSSAEGQTPFFSSDGYRIDAFRAPVPDHVPGARTVHTDEVAHLARAATQAAAIWIDVLPRPPRPAGLSATALWLPPARRNIPGSVWLPNVGYGRLSDELERYFHDNLQRLTGGDLDRPIVIYCLADCWMSWNAARRAARYGYRQVLWFPEGTDGWSAAKLPMAESSPVPIR